MTLPEIPAETVEEMRALQALATRARGGHAPNSPERVASVALASLMADLKSQGHIARQMAEAIGITRAAVEFRIKRHGHGTLPPSMSQDYYRGFRDYGTNGNGSRSFWDLVEAESAEGCWLWTGALNHGGYGRFRVGARSLMAHRVAYQELRADIPEGLQLDHLCCTRNCVNPWHLDPVTAVVNIRRAHGAAAPTPALWPTGGAA